MALFHCNYALTAKSKESYADHWSITWNHIKLNINISPEEINYCKIYMYLLYTLLKTFWICFCLLLYPLFKDIL